MRGDRLLESRDRDGFQPVFNGKDWTGWAGPVDNYEIVDGTLKCKPEQGGTIFTKKEYGDFAARLEIRLPAGGNNGLAIRYPGDGDTAYVGMCEIQMLDNEDSEVRDARSTAVPRIDLRDDPGRARLPASRR